MESEVKHLKRMRVCSLVCCTNPQNRNTSLQDTWWKKSYFFKKEMLLVSYASGWMKAFSYFFMKEVVALGIIKLEIHCNMSVKIEAYHAKVYVFIWIRDFRNSLKEILQHQDKLMGNEGKTTCFE